MPTAARRPPRYTDAGIELPRDADGRTRSFRRFRALVSAFEQELGPNLTEPDKALVRQVSSLQLRIEQMQCAIVAGRNDVSADEIIRLSSEHRRLLTTLRGKAAKKPAGPTLKDYLATRYGASAPADVDPEADAG